MILLFLKLFCIRKLSSITIGVFDRLSTLSRKMKNSKPSAGDKFLSSALVNDPSRQRPFNKESTTIVHLNDDRRGISSITRGRQIEGQREAFSKEKNHDFILMISSRPIESRVQRIVFGAPLNILLWKRECYSIMLGGCKTTFGNEK